jgi:hypothetical protein
MSDTDITQPQAEAFDLDALEREGAPIPVFKFTHGGRQYELLDPQEIDWQDLLTGMRNPGAFIRFALRAEDRKPFFDSPIAAWKMNALFDRYTKHYGLDLGNYGALPR